MKENAIVYEITSVRAPKVRTKMLVYGEARNTILNLVIGQNVQTYIKIKASDLVKVLEELSIVEKQGDKQIVSEPIEIF